jgi:hypothetical protein
MLISDIHIYSGTYFLGFLHTLAQCSANFFHPQHTLICLTHDGTPQNFASRKGGSKLYMAININYIQIFAL